MVYMSHFILTDVEFIKIKSRSFYIHTYVQVSVTFFLNLFGIWFSLSKYKTGFANEHFFSCTVVLNQNNFTTY